MDKEEQSNIVKEEQSNIVKEEQSNIVKVLQDVQTVNQQMQEIIDRLQDDNAALQVQNETWTRVSQSESTMEMASVAKVLNYKGLGRNKMFDVLRTIGILRYNNEPYQQFVVDGYFEVVEQEIPTNNGSMINRKTVVTQRGVDYIRKQLDKRGYENATR